MPAAAFDAKERLWRTKVQVSPPVAAVAPAAIGAIGCATTAADIDITTPTGLALRRKPCAPTKPGPVEAPQH